MTMRDDVEVRRTPGPLAHAPSRRSVPRMNTSEPAFDPTPQRPEPWPSGVPSEPLSDPATAEVATDPASGSPTWPTGHADAGRDLTPEALPAPDAVVAGGPPHPPARRRSRRRRWLQRGGAVMAVGVLSIALLGGGVAIDRSGVIGGPAAVPTPPAAGDFALISQAWDLLHQKYVGAATMDNRQLAYGAIRGMTDAIDDPGHTSFETPQEVAQSHDSLAGSYVGIGVELDVGDTGPVIAGVFKGGPASAAGIRQGDHLLSVDGKVVTGMGLDQVATLVRGAQGTQVTISVSRDGTSAPITVTLTRSKVELPSVEWATIPGTNFVMLRIAQFGTDSAAQLTKALEAIVASKASGIVLDLRGDPGGYVNEAVTATGDFLDSGNVHLSRDASGKITPTPVPTNGLDVKLPMVVLVDGGTASSAEILTGALQDSGRAKVVGVKTFGTGTVLSEVPLSDGSALRIGVIEWLTPKGRSIWRQGLTPDVNVPLASGVAPLVPSDLASLGAKGIAKSGDLQLLKAMAMLKADTAS
jgi:carboxyl-terminal processing protease